MSDLILKKNLKLGDQKGQVKLIQEWLCLNSLQVQIDKDFGPATEYAVKTFQKKKHLEDDGIVGPNTFKALIQPMTKVLEEIPADNKSLGQMMVAYARQHLKSHPREIGGQNMGPWVRLYMNKHEGVAWPWCAGFVCFIMKQACYSLDVRTPITSSFSCDYLAASAKENGLFLKQPAASDRNKIKKGFIFLNRRTDTDWVHTGIVLKTDTDVFHTIEGNTNDEGSREGYEVCERMRAYKKKDFVVM